MPAQRAQELDAGRKFQRSRRARVTFTLSLGHRIVSSYCTCLQKLSPCARARSVDLAPVCNVRHGHCFGWAIDCVDNPVITDPNAPLIFVTFQLFASHGPWVVCQRQNRPIYAGEQRVVERIQFLLRRLLDVERVFKHASQCASGGWRGIARKECPFPSGGIQTQGPPRSPPKWPRVFSDRFERRPYGLSRRSRTGFRSWLHCPPTRLCRASYAHSPPLVPIHW